MARNDIAVQSFSLYATRKRALILSGIRVVHRGEIDIFVVAFEFLKRRYFEQFNQV